MGELQITPTTIYVISFKFFKVLSWIILPYKLTKNLCIYLNNTDIDTLVGVKIKD
jgi:hypothetical protein